MSTRLGALPNFAHLLGRGAKTPRAEDPSDDKKDDDKDKKGKSAGAEDTDEDPDEDKDKDKKGKKAGSEDPDEEEDKDKKGKKGRAADDEDDEEMSDDDGEDEDDKSDRKDAKATAARKRERARCVAILTSSHAEGRGEMALHLAMNTGMGRRQAVALLKASPKSQPASGLAQRMAGMEAIRPGSDGNAKPSKQKAAASSWDDSAKRVGIKRD